MKKQKSRTWLINLRYKHNLSQAKLAAECSVSQVTICHIEHGKKRPTVELAKKIGEALNFEWTRFYE